MAKATALSSDLMEIQEDTSKSNFDQRGIIKPIAKQDAKKQETVEKQTPLQIRSPASKAKAIKREALEADQTVSEFMLACFNAYIKK